MFVESVGCMDFCLARIFLNEDVARRSSRAFAVKNNQRLIFCNYYVFKLNDEIISICHISVT